VVDDDAAGAQLGHEVERVGDEQDRLAGLLELLDLARHLRAKASSPTASTSSTSRTSGSTWHGDGEGQLHVLAGAVVLDRVVDAWALLGEGYDRLEQAVDLLLRQAEQRGVER
jgi:hypothetical protein